MTDIFAKCRSFSYARDMMKNGVYPYFFPLESGQDPEVILNGRKFLMVGSNNYLGLANDPRMKEAARKAMEKYGTGCAGSRFLNGNTVLHQELEQKLARFKHRQASLVYATGYQMNVGVVSCLVGKGDVAVVDKLDHASILDGCKMSNGEICRFKHNDMEDLEKVLSSIGPSKGKLVIVDGVFSMEGDICRLPEIVKIAKAHKARIMVDDAHATGVLGETGRGTCEYYDMEEGAVDLVVGTCSKTFAAVGGFVVGDEDIIHYIRHLSRSMIFSAALPPSCVATISKAIDLIDEEPERRIRLWENAKHLADGLKEMGFDTGRTQTPIIPLLIGDNDKTFLLWRLMFDAGIFVNPVISPAVPPNRTMIRMSLMATHTSAHIDRILGVIDSCAKKAGIPRRAAVASK